MSIFFSFQTLLAYSAQILVAIYTSSSTAGRKKVCTYQSPYIDWGFIYSLFQSKGVVKTSPFVAIYQPRSLLREFFFFYLSIAATHQIAYPTYYSNSSSQPSIICYSRLQMGILTQFQLAVKITNYHRTYTILQEHIDLLFCSLSSFIEKYEPSTN